MKRQARIGRGVAPIRPDPTTADGALPAKSDSETLAEEVPIALSYNGSAHAVMMATPADLDDFAIGFSLTEGIVDAIDQVQIVDRLRNERGISIEMLIPHLRFEALQARQRSLDGRTGCGLCGAATLEAAIRPIRQVTAMGSMPAQRIFDGFAALEAQQALNRATGAVHGAAWIAPDGTALAREDVGRHNAIDKVVGAALRAHLPPQLLLVTSRASYEVVHKAAQVGIAIVAAISAPTAFAVRLADEAGITLIGFARAPRLTVYTHASRIIG